MSWEESSSICKNYYGIVEEPRDERIIPIKIDRSISIHTASDEEEEPFWVVESVKKHEEVRNEIKKMKENKNLQASLGDSYDEEEDNSLIELLKRVQKQRNDLEDILEKENHNTIKFETNRTENILSRSNSMLSESSTLKARSVSRLSSVEENIKMGDLSDNLVNEFISNNSNTSTNNKKETSSITDNIPKELTSKTIYNLDEPKKVILSTDTLGKSCEHWDEIYSKHGERVLDERNSISRLSSIEECDNSVLSSKNIKEFSEMPKRPSLSTLPSTEYKKQDITLEKSISPIIKQDESNKDSISKSFPRYTTEESENNLTTINNTLNDKFKPISEQNLNESIHFSDRHDYLNNINDKPKSRYIKALDNDKSLQSSPIHMSNTDEADFRRKSLIRQSSMISDALSAMCAEIPEDNKYNKQKRPSIKEDNTYYDTKKNDENDLLTLLIKPPNSKKYPLLNEAEITDSLVGKSSISRTGDDENITQLENNLTPKLDVDDASKINNESFDSLPSKQKSEVSNTEPLGKSLHLEFNQKKLNNLTTKRADIDLLNGTLNNNSHMSNDCIPHSTSNSENKTSLLDKENNLNNEQRPISEPFLKDNNLDIILPKKSISSSDHENSMNDLQPNDSTNVIKNSQIPINKNSINKEDDIVQKPIPSLSDKGNGNKLPLGTQQKEGIECSTCNNNTDISPGDSLSSNYDDKFKNIVEDLHTADLINPSLTKEIIDTNILNIPLKKHLINKENYLNNTKTSSSIEKVNKINKENSQDGMNKENENISKLKTLNPSKEENYDMPRSGVKQIGGIQNIRCYNNVSVVFYLLFVKNSSLFRLLKLHIVLS